MDLRMVLIAWKYIIGTVYLVNKEEVNLREELTVT
jgi:hypothetical protein